MSIVKELIEAGIHFGQRRSNWNPKMRPYIFATRNQIHIIDIKETIKGLLLARKLIQKVTAEGKDVVFVGTKRQSQAAIEKYCTDIGMPYVTERWLGGTLTNFRTIRERLKRLEELEKLIESGEIRSYSKKMESQLLREQKKIFRNLNGIRTMNNLPGCDGRGRREPREERPLRSPEPRHPDHLPHRHRRRPRSRGHSDPRQRRLDAIHRRHRPRTLCRDRRRQGQASPGSSGTRRRRRHDEEDGGNQGRRRSSRSQFRAERTDASARDRARDGAPGRSRPRSRPRSGARARLQAT